MKRILAGTFFVLIFASMVLAQSSTGTILGVVKDSTGGVVPGASVTITETDTNQIRTVTTADQGEFRVPALPTGHYSVKIEKSGFKTEMQTGLTLTVAAELVVNSSLEVGSSAQEVTVTGEAPLVSTTTSSLGGLVDEQRISELPLNGRNYNDLTLLQPGVNQHVSYSTGAPGMIGTLYSSSGAPLRSNTYLLDGAILNDLNGINGASATGTTLGVDGIQEFRIITNSFSAEYGQSMGSQQVIVSKSGTNQFHGDAFEFLRNSALDARNFFDLQPGVLGHRLPEFRRNNFGGAFGGPIRRDKTFFYGVYEQLVQVFGTTQIATVPQAGCHGNAGDTITPAACPFLTGNAKIAPIMVPFLALYPIPNIGTGPAANQYGFTYAQPTNEKYGQMRVDQTLTSKDNFFARYTGDYADQILAFNFPDEVLNPLSSLDQFVTLSETHVFSTTVLNAARFSFSRTNVFLQNQAMGITGPQYSFVQGFPMGSLSISGGINSIGTNTVGDRRDKRNIFTWTDDVSYVRGAHALKFGVLINRYQDYMVGLNNKFSVSFGSLNGFLSGNTLANGSVSGQLGPLFDRTFHYYTMGFYVQDDYRVNAKLTLNLGLRYEPETTLHAPFGLNAAGCPQPAVPCELSSSFRNGYSDPGPTVGPPFNNPSHHNWSPRVGFAWDVFGDGKTAVRGGAALLYDLATWVPVVKLNAQSTPPFSSKFSLANVTLTNTPTACPGGVFSSTCSPLPYIAPTNQPNLYTGAYWNMNQPQMYQYNLAVQRQLPGGIALTVAYAGSSGLHLIQQRQLNPNIPNGVPSGGVCVAAPAGTTINYSSQVDGLATSCFAAGAKRINPNTAVSTLAVSLGDGHSNYNALEITAQKRLSKGFQLQSSYTWSRLIDNREAGQGADSSGAITTGGIDDLDLRTDRGPADFDLSDNWRTSAIYHVPNFTSSTRLLSKVVNGWGASGILSVTTGYPFTVSMSSNRSLNLTGTTGADDRPDLIPGRNNSNMTSGTSAGCGVGLTRAQGGSAIAVGTPLGTPSMWFDPCAFSVQPLGFVGNAPRNMLRGPGFTNLDFSIVKDTPLRKLGEQGNLQFRAEMFNVFNHANFSIPQVSTVIAGSLGAAVPGAYGTNTTSQQNPTATAGVITSTVNKSRQIQFALKVVF